MPDDPNIIKSNASLLINLRAACPGCREVVEVPTRLTIINSIPASMLLWSHDHPFMCEQCHTAFTIQMTQVDMRGVGWQPFQIEVKEKPLIDVVPNSFDITNILKNN